MTPQKQQPSDASKGQNEENSQQNSECQSAISLSESAPSRTQKAAPSVPVSCSPKKQARASQKSQERSVDSCASPSSRASVQKGIFQFLRLKSPTAKPESGRWQREYIVEKDDEIQEQVFYPEKKAFQSYLKQDSTPRTYFERSQNPAVSPQSIPLQRALLETGIEATTAATARRALNVFMDTPAYYKNAVETMNDYSRMKLRTAIAGGELCTGVTSLYLPGRAFYGLAQAQNIDFLDILHIYDEIEYEAPTPLFADSDDEESEEETSDNSDQEPADDANGQLVNLTDEELYLKLSGKVKVDADDLNQEDGFEQKGRSMAQMRLLYEFLSTKQALFDYPVTQMCPEGLRGQKSVMYCFQGSTQQIEREDIQIVSLKTPQRLLPLFLNVGEGGYDLKHCYDDQDYVVEYEREEVDE